MLESSVKRFEVSIITIILSNINNKYLTSQGQCKPDPLLE